jgi:hypothetical protein
LNARVAVDGDAGPRFDAASTGMMEDVFSESQRAKAAKADDR